MNYGLQAFILQYYIIQNRLNSDWKKSWISYFYCFRFICDNILRFVSQFLYLVIKYQFSCSAVYRSPLNLKMNIWRKIILVFVDDLERIVLPPRFTYISNNITGHRSSWNVFINYFCLCITPYIYTCNNTTF